MNKDMAARLAAIKDIPTDRLIELAQAEQDGRLVVLPDKDYCWHIRGDIAIGLIQANCRRAVQEAEAAMERREKEVAEHG